MKRSRLNTGKKKASFRSVKARLDQLCRAYVMERDGHKCRRCGIPRGEGHKNTQWAHIYSRRYLSIRWNPLNSCALCPGCHLWIHANPLDGAEWVASWMTAGERESLRDALKKPGKLDYGAVEKELKTLLAGVAPLD